MNTHNVFSYSKALELAGKAFALFILIFVVSATAHAANNLGTALKVQGDVLIKAPASQDFYSLEVGDQLAQGSTLKTGENSMALIKLPQGDILNLKANTELELKELNVLNPGQANETSTTRLYLNYGDVVSKVNKLVSGSVFQIQTAVGVAGVRGTTFQVSITKDENGQATMNITTAEGIVVLQSPALDAILATIPADSSVDATVEVDDVTGEAISGTINVSDNVTISSEQSAAVIQGIQTLVEEALAAETGGDGTTGNGDGNQGGNNQGGEPEPEPEPEPVPAPDVGAVDASTASPV